MSATTAASAAYIVAGLLFILSLAGLSKHETAKAGNGYGIAGMAIALAATIGLATRSITAIGLTLLIAAMIVGATIAPWGGPGGRDDRRARADRDPAQLRRPGRRPGRLERLPVGRGRPRHADRGRRQSA